MSKNERSKLREHTGLRKKQKRQRKPDRRIRRTCERLGSALVALIQERPIDDVTVQDVLDRASWVVPPFIFTFATRMTSCSAS